MQIYAQFPPILNFHPDDVRATSGVDTRTLFTRVMVLLEHLQNLFCLDRLLLQRGHESHADLLAVSFELVSMTLIFWRHMDRLAGLHGDYDWLVGFFPCRHKITLTCPPRRTPFTLFRKLTVTRSWPTPPPPAASSVSSS